jgi:hypothetical protein
MIDERGPEPDVGAGAGDDEAEIAAMSAVSRALRGLSEDEQRRVLDWAVKRFAAGQGAASAPGTLMLPAVVEQHDLGGPTFEHFAELMNRTQPRTDVERALAASYWVQEHEGMRGFAATDANARLREASQSISHMADAMGALQARRPALVIQLRKGRSRQSRKTYQVTVEGVAAVRAAIQAGGFGRGNGSDG